MATSRRSFRAPTRAIELAAGARAGRDRAADPERRTRRRPAHQRERSCAPLRDEPRSHTGGAARPRRVPPRAVGEESRSLRPRSIGGRGGRNLRRPRSARPIDRAARRRARHAGAAARHAGGRGRDGRSDRRARHQVLPRAEFEVSRHARRLCGQCPPDRNLSASDQRAAAVPAARICRMAADLRYPTRSTRRLSRPSGRAIRPAPGACCAGTRWRAVPVCTKRRRARSR